MRKKALWWGLLRNGERPPGRGLEVEGQGGEGCSSEVAAGAAENAYLVRDPRVRRSNMGSSLTPQHSEFLTLIPSAAL